MTLLLVVPVVGGLVRESQALVRRARVCKVLVVEGTLTWFRILLVEAVAQGLLSLHGAWVDIGAGKLFTLDRAGNAFVEV
jgi:hypothetical protein